MVTTSDSDWEVRFSELERAFNALQAEHRQLQAAYNNLKKTSSERIAALEVDNRELREKLRGNSSNSSRPPSQDLTRSKRKCKPTGRKQGGQPGHPGHAREIYPPEQVSKTIEVLPERCPECGHTQFEEAPVSIDSRQVVELPDIQPEVTQFDIYTCCCAHCGHHVRPEIPKEAQRGFGPRLMGFITLLSGDTGVTKRKIQSLVGYIGIRISLGSVCNIHEFATELLKFPYEKIRTGVLESEHINADETSWRCFSKRCWLWIATTLTATFFHIDPSRSSQAYQRVLGSFDKILTTDRYAGYNQHKGLHQLCLAHIDRDLKKVAEREGLDAFIGRILMQKLDSVFALWHKFKAAEISREQLIQGANQHTEDFNLFLKRGAWDDTDGKTQSLCNNLLKRFDSLWLFLHIEGVEPTNNLAERELRPAVIFRKLTGGSQSEWGMRYIERVMTVICTLKKRSVNIFKYLTDCFDAEIRDGPIPSTS